MEDAPEAIATILAAGIPREQWNTNPEGTAIPAREESERLGELTLNLISDSWGQKRFLLTIEACLTESKIRQQKLPSVDR